MLYFSTAGSPAVRAAMSAGLIGMLSPPAEGKYPPPGAAWFADNGCYGKCYPGDARYLAFLEARRPHAGRCWFAVAPDVPFDMNATLARSAPMLERIRAMGYPAAIAAQNGAIPPELPWGAFDVLMLGGDNTWKLGPDGRDLTAEAIRRGVPVHMGRVNSLRRLTYATAIGCSSADGTKLRYGPDKHLPTVLAWVRAVNGQVPLWQGQEAT